MLGFGKKKEKGSDVYHPGESSQSELSPEEKLEALRVKSGKKMVVLTFLLSISGMVVAFIPTLGLFGASSLFLVGFLAAVGAFYYGQRGVKPIVGLVVSILLPTIAALSLEVYPRVTTALEKAAAKAERQAEIEAARADLAKRQAELEQRALDGEIGVATELPDMEPGVYPGFTPDFSMDTMEGVSPVLQERFLVMRKMVEDDQMIFSGITQRELRENGIAYSSGPLTRFQLSRMLELGMIDKRQYDAFIAVGPVEITDSESVGPEDLPPGEIPPGVAGEGEGEYTGTSPRFSPPMIEGVETTEEAIPSPAGDVVVTREVGSRIAPGSAKLWQVLERGLLPGATGEDIVRAQRVALASGYDLVTFNKMDPGLRVFVIDSAFKRSLDKGKHDNQQAFLSGEGVSGGDVMGESETASETPNGG